MKTIVFHSVKGGVGRTLALCNFAEALVKIGKKVLMLDFDYQAPGLHVKFNRESSPGYIEYLSQYTAQDRVDSGLERKRRQSLRSKVKYVRDNMMLLSAGNQASADYWTFISSYRFHRLFYFGRKEVSKLSHISFPLNNLKINLNAFVEDKHLFEREFKPDYFLVDCKTAVDASAVPFLLWSDSIAHFLPPNVEGIEYTRQTAVAVLRYQQEFKTDKHRTFIPVVTRVPDIEQETERQHIKTDLEAEWRQKVIAEDQDFLDLENIVFLSTQRRLEQKECVVFMYDAADQSRMWQLSHDYLTLFARLAPEAVTVTDTSRTAIEDGWYKAMGMEANRRILAQYFDKYTHLGTMMNVDGEPNIAFRIKTFHLIMNNLLDSIGGKYKEIGFDVEQALHTAGDACGKDFGEELVGLLAKAGIISFEEKLKAWAEFDSGVGFGLIEIQADLQETPLKGHLVVHGDAFMERSSTSTEDSRDLRSFFCGYVAAILQKILDIDEVGKIKVSHINLTKNPIFRPELKTLRKSNDSNTPSHSLYSFERVEEI